MTIRQLIEANPYNGEVSVARYARRIQGIAKSQYGLTYSSGAIRSKYYKLATERMKVVRQRYDKNGNLVSTVQALRSTQVPNTDGYELEAITTSPSGGMWGKYKKKKIDLKAVLKDLKEILSKKIEPYTPTKVIPKGCTLIIASSDKHFGAHTKENSVYQNPYSPIIFRERHDKMIHRIAKEVSRFGKFDELVYLDLGDALDGWSGNTTRGGHKLPQNLDNKGQWRSYIEEHKRAFDMIIQMNPAAKYRFIGASNSNHGGDFDLIAMETLQLYLNLKYPFIKTHVSDKPFDDIEVAGKHIIYGHGKDDEDMKSGVPLSLNDKTENWINDYIDQKGLKGEIYFISGDLHQSAMCYGKRFRYWKVLSQYGSSKWIHSNFGSGRAGISYGIIDGSTLYPVDLFF